MREGRDHLSITYRKTWKITKGRLTSISGQKPHRRKTTTKEAWTTHSGMARRLVLWQRSTGLMKSLSRSIRRTNCSLEISADPAWYQSTPTLYNCENKTNALALRAQIHTTPSSTTDAVSIPWRSPNDQKTSDTRFRKPQKRKGRRKELQGAGRWLRLLRRGDCGLFLRGIGLCHDVEAFLWCCLSLGEPLSLLQRRPKEHWIP